MIDLFDLAPKDRLIAQLLVSHGVLRQDQLSKAMAQSRESFFFSLAEILIGSGTITLGELERILHDYARKMRLGELALAQGIITSEQLDMALAIQEASGEHRIGEIFLELHLATPQQISELLDFQARCRVEALSA